MCGHGGRNQPISFHALDQLPSMQVPGAKKLWCLMSLWLLPVFISVYTCYLLSQDIWNHTEEWFCFIPSSLGFDEGPEMRENGWHRLLCLGACGSQAEERHVSLATQRCAKSQYAKIQLSSWLLTSWFTTKCHKVKHSIAVREAKLELGVRDFRSSSFA